MRPMRRFAGSGRLIANLAASAALSLGAVAATVTGLALAAGPAQAATSSQPGSAVAFATPSAVTAGTAVTFQVTCGSLQATSATLSGTTLGLPEQIPMNKGAGGGVFSVTVTLPSSIRPGTFNPAIDCSDGSSTTARVRVTAMPSGGAATGDGTTSTATDTGLSAAGLVLIAVGAVAGGIALRRRSGTRS
jgi:hypothetical protein